jgi:hypothetical protein
MSYPLIPPIFSVVELSLFLINHFHLYKYCIKNKWPYFLSIINFHLWSSRLLCSSLLLFSFLPWYNIWIISNPVWDLNKTRIFLFCTGQLLWVLAYTYMHGHCKDQFRSQLYLLKCHFFFYGLSTMFCKRVERSFNISVAGFMEYWPIIFFYINFFLSCSIISHSWDTILIRIIYVSISY